MRVLVTGGRYYADREAVFRELDRIEAMSIAPAKLTIIEGGQRWIKDKEHLGGADWWANQWAAARGRTCITVNAEWDKHGLAAGPIRNSEMLSVWKPHICLVFPGNKGTNDMRTKAARAGVEIIEGGKR